MAQNTGSVQGGDPEYEDRSHTQTQTQAAHTDPMEKIIDLIPGGRTKPQHSIVNSSPTQKPGLGDKFKGMFAAGQTQTANSNPTQKPGLGDKFKDMLPAGLTQTANLLLIRPLTILLSLFP